MLCSMLRPFQVNVVVHVHCGPKKHATLLLSMSLPIIDRFSKFFYWHSLQTICNNVIIIDPTTQ